MAFLLSFSLSGSVVAGVPPAFDPPFAADTAASTPGLVASFMANKSLPYESQNASAQAGHVSRLFSLPGGGRPRCRRPNIWDTTARVPPSLRHVVPEPSLIASKRDGKYELLTQ